MKIAMAEGGTLSDWAKTAGSSNETRQDNKGTHMQYLVITGRV